MCFVGELDQVEIGVRNQNIFRLAAHPSAHVHVAVSGAGTRRIHGQADSGLAFPAIAAAPAGDVERHGDQVAHVEELDVAALLDNLARDLVSQHQARRRGGPAANHVLIAATNIGGDDLQDDAVIDLLARRVLQFRDSRWIGPRPCPVPDTLHLDYLPYESPFDFLVKAKLI